jgi:hypothetical protein
MGVGYYVKRAAVGPRGRASQIVSSNRLSTDRNSIRSARPHPIHIDIDSHPFVPYLFGMTYIAHTLIRIAR